jgi:MFS family permease
VLLGLIGGVLVLVVFGIIESRVAEPMFPLGLFKNVGFTTGNAANLLASVARGGLQFMLIIWLQGIWLPLHGYSYESTPLWAGIYLVPMTIGFLAAGPLSGYLSDKFGPRPFAAGGLLVMAASFLGLLALPGDFNYMVFAILIFINGLGGGLFAAPNTSLIMSSVPANMRGAASGMRATFQNAGMVLSIGVFFSLMVAGLANSLPHTLSAGLTGQGVPADTAGAIAQLPPVGTLFAAFLGYNPIGQLLGPQVLGALPPANAANLTGLEFFPRLIAEPFHDGLVIVFWMAIGLLVVGAIASLVRGKKPAAAADREAAFVAREAEVKAEVSDAQPLSPATGVAEPIDSK